nr:retrovirus-related Pol polyprotein from transposon TNT 1-94 [Tanacetum cinerariifolium]
MPYVLIGLRIPEEEWRAKDTSLAHLKNKTCSLVRISAEKKASQRLWMFKVKEELNGRKRYKARLEPSYVRALNDTSTQHKSEGFQLAVQEENLECRFKEILSSTEATILGTKSLAAMFTRLVIPSQLITDNGDLPERGLRIPEEEWRAKDTSLTHLKAVARMKCDRTFGYKESPGYLDPGGSSNTSERSENSGSFEDSGRSDGEYSKDEASYKEGGSETPHVRRSIRECRAPWKKAINKETILLVKNKTCSLVRISAEKKASQRLWMFKVKEELNGRKRYKARLVVKGFQQKRMVDYNEIFSPR